MTGFAIRRACARPLHRFTSFVNAALNIGGYSNSAINITLCIFLFITGAKLVLSNLCI